MDLLLYNNTKREYDEQITIQQLFEEQVILHNDKISAIYRDTELTYGELNKKANQLARLLRKKGIRPGTIVGIMVKRSIDMLIGMLGILKAGGCYLPIDPKFPQTRIDYMLENSKAEILLTHSELDQVVNCNIEILHMDGDIYHEEDTNIENLNKSSDPAYVIYTSGSTGKPKGVVIPHRAVHNFINGITDIIDFSVDKVIVSLTTISFDIFVLESLLPLAKGLTIIIADPMTFSRDMEGKSANIVQTTPSTMKLILNNPDNLKYLDSFTDILLGGEPFPKRLLEDLKQISKAKIYNMYGPTETTVWSMVKELTECDEITIGMPIANTQICITDQDAKPVPYGEEGEICIAGDGVAIGYLYLDELTKQRFIPSVFYEGNTMYRTGDLGKYLPSGEIEFLGRIDSQVKVRGFRIELEEIECAMLKIPEIKECVVSTKKNKNDEKYLVGYYVADEVISNTYIIQNLKEVLPEYMIPGMYMQLNEIPLTPNGKANKLALPDIDLKRPCLAVEYVTPETEMEKKIANIWIDVLNIDRVGVLDNFFDLGGNSIQVSKVVNEINQSIDERVEVSMLFTYPTVRQLSKAMLDLDCEKIGTILENDFYCQEAGKFNLVHNEFQLSEGAEKFESSLFVSVFMYLLSDVSFSSNVEMVCNMGEGLRKVSCDFTDITDLESIMNLVEASYAANTNFVDSAYRNSQVSDDQSILFNMLFDEDENHVDIGENEVCISLSQRKSSINVYYNSGLLSKSKVEAFFDQFVEFIASLLEEA